MKKNAQMHTALLNKASIITDIKDLLYIICTHSWIYNQYWTDRNRKSRNEAIILDDIFEINTPFLMDGEAKKLSLKLSEGAYSSQSEDQCILKEHFTSKVKRRKIECVLASEEMKNLELVSAHWSRLRSNSVFNDHFQFRPTAEHFLSNNSSSRKAKDAFLSSCDARLLSMDGRNDLSTTATHAHNGRNYLIPPKCHYVNGDVFDLLSLLGDVTFDLVVMDPPWRNKHVRRKRRARGGTQSYETLSVEDVMQIPLLQILSPDALVLIWVTNSAAAFHDLRASLRASWDLEPIATWFWLKVTKSGEPVVDFSSARARGKLPYEKLLLTRRIGSQRGWGSLPPEDLVFCAVPSSVHSHKPPLDELLRKVLGLGDSERCLELFARSLTPGWTCLGNEVLRFQDEVLFQDMPGSEPTPAVDLEGVL